MKITEKLMSHSYASEFVRCLEEIEKKYGWEFFNLSGIGDQLDVNSFGKKFFNTKVTADSSVDPSSNIFDRSVTAYHFEAHKPQETINALYRLWKGLVKLKKSEYKKEYSDSDFVRYKAVTYANNAIEKQISGEIYINDITGVSTNRPYCYNYCTLDIATLGIPKDFDGEGVSPPKHLTTFFSQLLDFMIYAGNSTLGAVGVADALITTTCYFKKVLEQCGDDNVNFSSEEDCWQYLRAKFEKFLYDINKPNRANQSLFSNLSIYDDIFLKDLCPSYVIEVDGKMYSADVEMVKKVQDVFIEVYNKEQKRRLMTFPVLTPCFALDKERNLLQRDFLKKCIEQNQDFKMMNFYGGETSTLSSCCRLRSKKDAKYMNTIGSGNVKIGSIGVCSINLPRLAHNSKNLEELKINLEELVEVCQAINYVKRKNIKKAIAQGRIPLYTHGFININTQYNTVGVIGFNEMCENMGVEIVSEQGQDLVLEVMKTLNTKNEEMSDKYEVPSNVEQIPGENVAIKLCKKDTLLGYNSKHEMYSNQFIPLVSKSNMFDRIELQSKFDKHFGGGSILHINIDEMDADAETQTELVETMFKKGVIYFAFNSIIGVCNECGVNTPQNKSDVSEENTGKCRKCGSTDVDVAFRVVGFVRKVKNWAKQRREEFKNREFYNL